jgi:predicted nucleotidyltransferase component of viral defense system
MELLNKAQLQIINRRSKLGYPLDAAEKDYFLALVLKILYGSPLQEKLIFKGGTALYHTCRWRNANLRHDVSFLPFLLQC